MAKKLAPNVLVDCRCGEISVACLELMPVWSENLIPKCKVLWTWQSDQPLGVNLEAFCFMVCKVPRQGNRSLALGIASVSQQPKSFDHAEAWKQAELWTMTSGHLPGPTLWGSTTWRRCNAQQAPNCGSVCTVGFELRTQHLLAFRAPHAFVQQWRLDSWWNAYAPVVNIGPRNRDWTHAKTFGLPIPDLWWRLHLHCFLKRGNLYGQRASTECFGWPSVRKNKRGMPRTDAGLIRKSHTKMQSALNLTKWPATGRKFRSSLL